LISWVRSAELPKKRHLWLVTTSEQLNTNIKKYNEENACLSASGNLEMDAQLGWQMVHSQFLVEYVDKYPSAILSDINQRLCEGFARLSISIYAPQIPDPEV
jgi:hypothetical protein